MVITNLLKKVVVNVSTQRIAFKVKVNVHVFAKTTRIVISNCLGIAKSFQNAVWLEKNVLYSKLMKILTKKPHIYTKKLPFNFSLPMNVGDRSNVSHNDFGSFGFTSTTFTCKNKVVFILKILFIFWVYLKWECKYLLFVVSSFCRQHLQLQRCAVSFQRFLFPCIHWHGFGHRFAEFCMG